MTTKPTPAAEAASSNPMAELLQKSGADVPKLGDVMKGKVVSVSRNEVVVDLGSFGTGIVRGKEWFDVMDMYVELEPGDTVEASITELENENGQVDLSLKKAGLEKAWDAIKRLKEENKAFEVFVQEANKGGVIANVRGIQAFLPVSQLNSEHYPRVEGGDKNMILEKLKRLSNKELTVKVLDYDPEEEKLIISEKEAEAEKKEFALRDYKVGAVIDGVVTGVVDFGVFVRFGDKEDLEGLVHISELAWKRIEHPRDIVKVGDKIKVKIIAIDGARISLSLKSLQEDPWMKSAKKYAIGQEVEGKVTKVTPFGAFVQLDSDIHGLAHVSELSADGKTPEAVLNVGDKKKFKIISIEPSDHRLGLSLKEAGKKPAPSQAEGTGAAAEKQAEAKPKVVTAAKPEDKQGEPQVAKPEPVVKVEKREKVAEQKKPEKAEKAAKKEKKKTAKKK